MNNLELKSCLIGTLLGDAYIEKTSSISARMSFTHCIKQKDYLLWKVELLKQLTGVNVYDIDNNGNKGVRAETKSIPYFLTLRNQLYFQGRKSITSHLMKILDWRGIALWFLDDGYLDRNRAHFFTHAFTEAENYLMKHYLAEINNIHTSVAKRRKYFYLTTCAEDTAKIVEYVKKLNIPSMEYKISSYEKLSPPPFKNQKWQYVKGHSNEERW